MDAQKNSGAPENVGKAVCHTQTGGKVMDCDTQSSGKVSSSDQNAQAHSESSSRITSQVDVESKSVAAGVGAAKWAPPPVRRKWVLDEDFAPKGAATRKESQAGGLKRPASDDPEPLYPVTKKMRPLYWPGEEYFVSAEVFADPEVYKAFRKAGWVEPMERTKKDREAPKLGGQKVNASKAVSLRAASKEICKMPQGALTREGVSTGSPPLLEKAMTSFELACNDMKAFLTKAEQDKETNVLKFNTRGVSTDSKVSLLTLCYAQVLHAAKKNPLSLRSELETMQRCVFDLARLTSIEPGAANALGDCILKIHQESQKPGGGDTNFWYQRMKQALKSEGVSTSTITVNRKREQKTSPLGPYADLGIRVTRMLRRNADASETRDQEGQELWNAVADLPEKIAQLVALRFSDRDTHREAIVSYASSEHHLAGQLEGHERLLIESMQAEIGAWVVDLKNRLTRAARLLRDEAARPGYVEQYGAEIVRLAALQFHLSLRPKSGC